MSVIHASRRRAAIATCAAVAGIALLAGLGPGPAANAAAPSGTDDAKCQQAQQNVADQKAKKQKAKKKYKKAKKNGTKKQKSKAKKKLTNAKNGLAGAESKEEQACGGGSHGKPDKPERPTH